MKLTRPFLLAASAVALLGGAAAADAHGIWFAQRSKQLALIYGVGADDLDMVKRQPMVTGIAGYDADYQPVPTSLRVAGAIMVVDSDEPTTVVTAVLDNGTWSKAKDGEFYKKGRDEMPESTLSEWTVKYAVRLNGPLARPLPLFPDQKLQISPVGTAIPAEMGKPITLRVTLNGQPVAGVMMQNDYVNDPDQKPVLTDANGMVTLPVRNQGLNVIAGTYEGKSDQPAKYDRIEYRATLTFVLPHAPE